MTSDGSVEDLASRREDYARGGLVEADLADDPIAMFERWYADADRKSVV